MLFRSIVDCQDYSRTIRFVDTNPTNSPDATTDYISGGTAPYTYRWSGASVVSTFGNAAETDLAKRFTTNTLSAGGLYSLTVTDANGCEMTKTITLPDDITVDTDVTDVNCHGGSDGAIAIAVSGVTNPTYQWYKLVGGAYTAIDKTVNPSAETSKLSNINAGTYAVDVTRPNDVSACTKRFSNIVVSEPVSELRTWVYKTDATGCDNSNNGAVHVVTQDGTAPYTFTLYGGAEPVSVTSQSGDYW